MSMRIIASNEPPPWNNLNERQRQLNGVLTGGLHRESREITNEGGVTDACGKYTQVYCLSQSNLGDTGEDEDSSSGNQSEIILVDRRLPSGHLRPTEQLSRKTARNTTVEPCFQDNGVSRPSLSASIDSVNSKTHPHTAVGLRVAHACDSLMSTFRDNYKRVCSQSGKVVQSLLDGLQTLLDYSQLDMHSRMSVSVAIVGLSRKSGLCPDSFKFSLTDIGRAGIYTDDAQTNGHFTDIYKGYLKDRNVCLKIIRVQGSDTGEHYKKVCREAVVWGQLSHPNILPFYGLYQVDDACTQIGIVSPWMHLGNITDVLKHEANMDCRLWISDIAAGMAYLHGHHIVHGSLKGGNILITESRRACLADFGLASVTCPPLQSQPPENASNPSSDVYAFADLCYEIFTGEPPTNAHNICTISNTTRTSRPSSFYQRTRFLTDTMWALMETCWEYDAGRRPTAARILEKLPRASFDARPSGGWGILSSSSFRTHHNPHDHQKDQDAFVVKALQSLENTIAHIAGSHDCRTRNTSYKFDNTAPTPRTSLHRSSSPSKLGQSSRARSILPGGSDIHIRKVGQGDELSYARHCRPSHSPVSPGQGRQWHNETDTDTDHNFSSDRVSGGYSALENIPRKETLTLAPRPGRHQEIRPLPTTKADRLSNIVSRISSLFGDTQQYHLFLAYERTEDQTQTLLDLLQELLDMSLDNQLRQKIVKGIQRLSKISGLYPKCFALENVNLDNDIPLSAGGFADVYKGSNRGQAVCVKVIRLYEVPRVDYVLKRFYQETSLWGKLSHPNILPFYGQFRYRAQLSLVSPWMNNGNVNDYLKSDPLVDRVRLSHEIAAGLSYLHAHGIVHGDLKGANILVTDSGRACLSDFGLSAIIDSQILRWTTHTSVASQGGAIRWQAPELFDLEGDSEQNNKPSDIYAWACVLYEIFAGKVPFFEYRRDSTVMVNISLGKRPSRPGSSSLAWSSWGLTDSIWSLMEDCWKDNPHQRPSIGDALNRLQIAPETGQEHSSTEDWVNLPLKSFRTPGDIDYPSEHEFEGLLWGTTTDTN